MTEEWRDVPGYEGLYQASTEGRIKSLNYKRTGEERILKPAKNPKGYLTTVFFKNGRHKTVTVHRIVAVTFVPNPLNLPEINHKDENKENNCADNLEWCNRKYNVTYGTGRKRAAESCSKPVVQYSLDGNIVYNKWKSAAEIERELGYFSTSITACCKGKYKTYKGFVWKYAE